MAERATSSTTTPPRPVLYSHALDHDSGAVLVRPRSGGGPAGYRVVKYADGTRQCLGCSEFAEVGSCRHIRTLLRTGLFF